MRVSKYSLLAGIFAEMELGLSQLGNGDTRGWSERSFFFFMFHGL
jgi:hypothetical protein